MVPVHELAQIFWPKWYIPKTPSEQERIHLVLEDMARKKHKEVFGISRGVGAGRIFINYNLEN